MTKHDDLLAAHGVPARRDQHGQTVSYQPVGGEAVELTGEAGPEWVDEEDDGGGTRQKRRRMLTISTDPASAYGGVAEPATNAAVTIGTSVYEVERIEAIDGTEAVLQLIRTGAVERRRPDYRVPGR